MYFTNSFTVCYQIVITHLKQIYLKMPPFTALHRWCGRTCQDNTNYTFMREIKPQMACVILSKRLHSRNKVKLDHTVGITCVNNASQALGIISANSTLPQLDLQLHTTSLFQNHRSSHNNKTFGFRSMQGCSLVSWLKQSVLRCPLAIEKDLGNEKDSNKNHYNIVVL